MLTLTEAAGAHLAGILDNRDYPDGMAVRFAYRDPDVSIAVDNKKPGDSTVEHQGRTVLLLDQNVADFLANETDLPAKSFKRKIHNRNIVEQNASVRRIKEPRQQAHQC